MHSDRYQRTFVNESSRWGCTAAVARNAAAVVVLLLSSRVMAAPYVEPATSLTFPDRLDIFRNSRSWLVRGEVTTYPDARAGVSVPYVFVDDAIVRATVFIYDEGATGIANGLQSAITQRTCRDIANIASLQAVGYTNIRIDDHDEDGSRHQIGSLPACHVAFNFVGPMDRTRNSFTYVTGYNGKVIKIRFTNLTAHALIADSARERLLQFIGNQMRAR